MCLNNLLVLQNALTNSLFKLEFINDFFFTFKLLFIINLFSKSYKMIIAVEFVYLKFQVLKTSNVKPRYRRLLNFYVKKIYNEYFGQYL